MVLVTQWAPSMQKVLALGFTLSFCGWFYPILFLAEIFFLSFSISLFFCCISWVLNIFTYWVFYLFHCIFYIHELSFWISECSFKKKESILFLSVACNIFYLHVCISDSMLFKCASCTLSIASKCVLWSPSSKSEVSSLVFGYLFLFKG